MNAGNSAAKPAESVDPPRIANVARQKPTAVAPVSPKNMRAGKVLYGRNPAMPPASSSAAPAVADSFASRNTPASANAEMSASPADSPSSPSTILKALVMPTSQTTDSGYASHPMVIVCPNR